MAAPNSCSSTSWSTQRAELLLWHHDLVTAVSTGVPSAAAFIGVQYAALARDAASANVSADQTLPAPGPAATATSTPPSSTPTAEWSADLVPTWTTPGAWRRFTRKVVVTPGCWFWLGAVADDGYGRFADHEGRIVRVSRYVLSACTGALPHELVAEHRVCDEPTCTRLSHLHGSTQAENLQTARRCDRAGNGHHVGSADRRGRVARSRAIRDALRGPAGGWVYHPGRLAAAIADGDPHASQTLLFEMSTL